MKDNMLIKETYSKTEFYSLGNVMKLDDPAISSKPDKKVSSGFETVIFNKQLTTLICCPITVSGNYTIPASVKSIGIEAFSQCKGLTSIIFPLSLKTIGCQAFESCINLTSITLPVEIEEIGFRVFSNCIGLKSIFIRNDSIIHLKKDSQIFYKVDKRTCILFVPPGSKKKFQKASQWKEFYNIIEVDDSSHFTN